MSNNELNKNLSVHCGNQSDGFYKLKEICEKEAEKCLATIIVPDGDFVSVSFWTSDSHELIGVGKFYAAESGRLVYELDFSETTL